MNPLFSRMVIAQEDTGPKPICYKNKIEEFHTVIKDNKERNVITDNKERIVIKEFNEGVITSKVEETNEDYKLKHIEECFTDQMIANKQEEATNINSINDKPSVSSSSSFISKIFNNQATKLKSVLKKKKKISLMT